MSNSFGKIDPAFFVLNYYGFNIYRFGLNEWIIRHAASMEILADDGRPVWNEEKLAFILDAIREYKETNQ